MDTITYLDDSAVLIPHLADWTVPPECPRAWETGISTGITVAEDRQALRQSPMRSMSWTVMPFDLMEHERFLACIRAAKKKGNAAAPWWGRALRIGAAGVDPGATMIPISDLVPTAWLPEVGAQIWAALPVWSTPGGATWELWTVIGVAAGDPGVEHLIEISAPTALRLAGGATAVWPLIRGQFSCDEAAFDRPNTTRYRLAVKGPTGRIDPADAFAGISRSAALVCWGRMGPFDASIYSSVPDWWMYPDIVMLSGLVSSQTMSTLQRTGGFPFTTHFGTTRQVASYSTAEVVRNFGWSASQNFAQFNESLGRLNEIGFQLTSKIRATPRAENLDASPATLTVGGTVTVTLLDPAAVPLISGTATKTVDRTVYGYDGVTDYAGAEGTASGFVVDPAISDSVTNSISLHAGDSQWGQFLGSGTIDLTISCSGAHIATGSPSISRLGDTQGGAEITHTYKYYANEGYVWIAVPAWTQWAPRPGDGVKLLSTGAVFPMATAADLGGSTEINGYGYVLVEDPEANLYWIFRSKNPVYSGDDDALVITPVL